MKPTRDRHNVALGRAIRQLRAAASLTQQQLATVAKVPVGELRRIEHGDVAADWGTVRHLAVGMKVNLGDVFRLTEELTED